MHEAFDAQASATPSDVCAVSRVGLAGVGDPGDRGERQEGAPIADSALRRARVRAKTQDPGPKLVESGRVGTDTSVEIGPLSVDAEPTWPTFSQFWAQLARIWRNSANFDAPREAERESLRT